MKFNKIIFVGIFLLALLTLGTAAADDLQENLTVTDTQQTDSNSPQVAVADNGGMLSEIKDFDMYFDGLPIDENDIKYGEDVDFTVQFYKKGVSGLIDIYVDGEDFQYEVIGSTGNQVRFHVNDFGLHEIIIEYTGNYPTLRHEFNYTADDFYIKAYPDDDKFLYGHDTFLNIDTLPGMTGEINVVIGNSSFELKRLSDDLYESGILIPSNTLKLGDVITLNYTKGKNDKFWTKSFNYTVDLTSQIMVPYNNWHYMQAQNITFNLPAEASGTLYVNVDGLAAGSTKLINGSAVLPLVISDIGVHTINAVYADDLGFNITSGNVIVEVLPKIDYGKKISVNGSVISVSMPQNLTGSVEAYIEDYLAVEVLRLINSSQIINGSASIPINLDVGDYAILVRYNLSDASIWEDAIFLSVLSQNLNWTMQIVAEKELMRQERQFLLTLTNAHFTFEDDFNLVIDGKKHEYVQSGGYFYIDASDLDYGNHTFFLEFLGDEYFHSANASGTFDVAPILVRLSSELDMSYDNEMEIILAEDATGKITVKQNGKTISRGNVEDFAELFDGFLQANIPIDDLKYGISEFEIEYVGNYAESYKKTLTANATYILDIRNETRYGGDTVEIMAPSDITSGIALKIDGVSVAVNHKVGELGPYFYFESPANLTCGMHEAVISYVGDEKYPAREVKRTFEVKPMIFFCYKDYDGFDGVWLIMPDDAKGNFTLYVDHEVFKSIKANGNVSISLEEFKWGNYLLIAKYEGDDYDVGDLIDEYHISPEFSGPEKMLYKSDDSVSINLTGAYGKLEVYSNELYLQTKLVDGFASIPLSELAPGENELLIMYSQEDEYGNFIATFDKMATVNVINPIIAANANVLYSSGTNYKARIVDIDGKPVNGATVTFYINSKKVLTTKTDKNGYAALKVTQTPKTYTIKTVYNKVSVAKKLTVKHVVALKSINVKKSAKKLVLRATLSKVNGKYLKAKKVTFKFNGKTYKAKTNKKGVAKVTIAKSVLKKLKVGKKVTYQATYLKDTVKKSVKIRK